MNLALPGGYPAAFVIFGLAVLLLNAIRAHLDNKRNPLRFNLPPGPKGYPIIGSLLDLPALYQWLTYADWAKVYGDIFSIEVLGRRIIILSSAAAVQDLFEKRSANYSDRTRFPMLLELMNNTFNFTLFRYGKWWRMHRKIFTQHFQASAVHNYHPIQAQQARVFLKKVLDSPERIFSHIRENLASTIMTVAYGITIKGFDDPYIRNVEESMAGFTAAAAPGTFLVDLIPVLKYVPVWFPGAGFKRKAAHWARVNQDVMDLPFDHVVREVKAGTARPSIAASLISAIAEAGANNRAEETVIAKNVTAITYEAGADTTISAIQTFFLAMALYPDIQKKAQAELDTVIGPLRLPEFNDRPSLPYVNALIKETLRWQPVGPLGIPHMVTEDDVYRGYFIPGGATIIGNVWAILHDETVFNNPEEFKPERFLRDGQLDPDVLQPEQFAFGFGRRTCPGRHFADNTIFLIIASTLHAFNISPGLDENGVPTLLSPKMTGGLVSYPEPFQVGIKPRNASAVALVRDSRLHD